MSSKALPFYKPPIYGRLHHGLPLSTIPMENDSLRRWFYSNYIQLSCSVEIGGSYELNFYEYYMHEHRFPNFKMEQFKKRTLRNIVAPNLSFFFERCIEHDFYVLTYFDEFYLPLKNEGKKHIIRDCLISGFDSQLSIFNIVGFKKNGQLGIEKASYSVLEYALENTPDVEDWASYVYLLKPVFSTDYAFDIEWITHNLHHYLTSTDSLPNMRLYAKRPSYIFGLDSLTKFANDLEMEVFKGNHYIPSHILWEHKQCMVNRVKYILSMQACLSDKVMPYVQRLNSIKRDAELLKNMSLRANLTADLKIEKEMAQLIRSIRDNDEEVLGELLNTLNNPDIKEVIKDNSNEEKVIRVQTGEDI